MLGVSGREWAGKGLKIQAIRPAQDKSGQETDMVIGAGITGLAAAYILQQGGHEVLVFESEPCCGGQAQTLTHEDFRFDLGGHRFYTKNEEVSQLVKNLVGDDLLTLQRISRIYINGRFVDYPLSFRSTMSALSPMTSLQVVGSYARSRLPKFLGGLRRKKLETFEDWVTSRFGQKLNDIYFKPYSEKVWGVKCAELTADFAEQRIKGLSFRAAVQDMYRRFNKNVESTSLVKWFFYPRYGFGQIPDALSANLKPGSLYLSSRVIGCLHDDRRITHIIVKQGDTLQQYSCRQVVMTMPIDEFVGLLEPAPPPNVLAAAQALRYRDILICFVVFPREHVTREHWIYFGSPDVLFGRIHEPKNWSSAMAPQGATGLVVEIFCFKTDAIWSESDDKILSLVVKELDRLGLVKASEYQSGKVVRLEKAYPLYTRGYKENLATITQYLSRFGNLQCAGRNGLFCYSSGDRHMEMGIRAAKNILGEQHDLGQVGRECVYAEK